MQEKENLTRQIMAEVANGEERRLKQTVKKALPFLLVAFAAGSLGLGRVVLSLMGKGVLDLFRALAMRGMNTDVKSVLKIFWEEAEKGAVAVLVIGAFAGMAVVMLTRIWRWPERWRDIKRYKQK